MENKNCYYFSLVTGQVEKIMETDLPILEKYQIPIAKAPKDTCSTCFGRGYH